MPMVAEKEGKRQTRKEDAVLTTTLNVVFNGTMVMEFGEEEITVIAPYIDDKLHRYEINHADFRGNKEVRIAIPGSPKRPAMWGRIMDPNQVLIVDQSNIGGMPHRGNNDAVIKLPYPERIYPLRLLDMKFDHPSGNGRYAGALVFVYPAAVEGAIQVSGVSCTVRNPIANYSELYVLASITPHTDDPDDHHSRMSWAAVKNLIHNTWEWESGSDGSPQPKRVPGMDCDVDAKEYPIQDPGDLTILGGGNCKVPIAIVTYDPLPPKK
jgi:hypothetical protein